MKSSFSSHGQSNALFNKSKKGLKYGVYFFLAISLIILGRIDHPWFREIHAGIGVVVTPVVVAFDAVGDAGSDTISWVQGLAALEAENNRLQEENARLRKFEFAADRGGREIQRLQELLKMRPTFVPTLVTARVIAVAGGPYTRSVLIHAGSEDGVRQGLPVVDEQGLVAAVFAKQKHILIGFDEMAPLGDKHDFKNCKIGHFIHANSAKGRHAAWEQYLQRHDL